MYLKAEGIERQERLQYLRQTWKSSIWSEEDDDSYTLPDPEIPLVYSVHYGQQCPPECDDGSVPAETADRQKKKEHGKSNLHAEEGFLQKLESLKGSSGQDRTSLKACVFPRIRFVMFTAILSLRYRAQYLAVLTHVCYINPYIILSRCGADAAFWALHGTRAH